MVVDARHGLGSLVRKVLRLHRSKLPLPMRQLGDSYFKDEVSKHVAGNTTEEQWRTFYSEWEAYCTLLGPIDKGDGSRESYQRLGIDRDGQMTSSTIESMSEEQKARLVQLEKEALMFGRDMWQHVDSKSDK